MDGKVFAQRLKALRKEKKLTQGELGRMIYVTASHISHIERYDDVPSRKVIKLLSIALNVSEDYLLGLTDERDSNPPRYELEVDVGNDGAYAYVRCVYCNEYTGIGLGLIGSTLKFDVPARCPHCGKRGGWL